MKAIMSVDLDTVWTNTVHAAVEVELDNPHTLTSRMLSELMVARLKGMVAEIRHANEVAAGEMLAEDEVRPPASQAQPSTGEPERERQAYEDLRREKEANERLRS